MNSRPLVIDTDGGIDDAAALFFAATSEFVDLAGVTVVGGNVSIDVATRSVCTVLEAAGRTDVRVAIGEHTPAGPVPALRPADFIHGLDGLGNTGRSPQASWTIEPDATALIHDVCAERPGEVSLVTLGPLTNVAIALRSQPKLAALVDRLVVMGGTIAVQGNALPAAEANIAHDPIAASEVVIAAWRQPPLLVGLDVTHQATFTASEVALLAEERTAAASFLHEPLDFYRRSAGTFCAPGEFPCHDLLATMAAVLPLVDGPVLPLAVQTAPGPAWGATVADRRVPFFERAGAGSVQSTVSEFARWQIGLDVDVDAFRRAVRSMFGDDQR
ncbi:MAG: nucleoside hydrolase [Ilumatobacter sp.]|uniref:nucleoside hydrolase n=1 Tax=Ilumatobacter sp. TaxID=1967498 RepID=UPI00391D7E3D